MSNTITFTIQGDSEGFVTFECPYCGLTKERGEFYSSEVNEQIQALIDNYVADMLNNAFGKMARSINRSKGLIKMKYKRLKSRRLIRTKGIAIEAVPLVLPMSCLCYAHFFAYKKTILCR